MNPSVTRLEFLTPCFSTGADQKSPEIRPASIRGQFHLWLRLLGYGFDIERRIFGGIKATSRTGNWSEHASPLVVRVSGIDAKPFGSFATLPHKNGGPAAFKPAFPPGTAFDLHLINRLAKFSPDEETAIGHTLRAWLLCGGLGLRSGRGGGAFQSPGAWASPADWEQSFLALPATRQFGAAALPTSYSSAEAARRDVTDTLSGLRHLNHPLGMVNPGRKTSPLRLTVRDFSGKCHIIASWDKRTQVTGNSAADLAGAAKELAAAGKPLGPQLSSVMPSLV